MQIFLVSFLLFFLFSCSKFEVGYQLAPRVISNKLDDAFDFKSQRLNEIRAQIAADFKKNQRDVAKFIIKTSDELITISEKKDVTKVEFLTVINKARLEAEPVMAQFKGSFDVVLNNLTPEEFHSFDKFSAKKNKELDEKISDKEKYLKHQLKTFDKTMDFFFDFATPKQVEMYKKFFAENYEFFLVQQESQKEFSKKFLVLQNKKEELVDYVFKFYGNNMAIRADKYKKMYPAFEKSFADLEFNIWASRTEKQQKYFKTNMTKLKDELLPLTL